MAKRDVQEFVPPLAGIYPAFANELKDKVIVPKTGQSAGQEVTVIEWNWTAFGESVEGNGEALFYPNDITSTMVSEGSRYGARYKAIKGIKELPEDGTDDDELLGIPVWITITHDGKIADSIIPMKASELKKQDKAFVEALESMKNASMGASDEVDPEIAKEIDNIPF